MTEPGTGSYERRIAELERRVAELEKRESATGEVAAGVEAPVTAAAGAAAGLRGSGALAGVEATRTGARPTQQRPRRSADDWFNQGEGWLGRAGVALVTLGVIFLFRYAVDRGWLTPELRIATGLVIGAGLLGAGLRFFEDRVRYRLILMGGGVIILFITGLAASELYGLISGGVALLFHGAVAVAAFTIAVRQRDTIMASVASVGSLVPPVFLLQDTVAGPVLWLYLLIMASWSALLVARHEPGPFSILAVSSAVLATFRSVPDDAATRGGAVAAVVAVWIGFAALPLLRSTLRWALPFRPGDERVMALRFAQPLLVTLALAAAMHALVWRGPYTFEASMAAAAAGFAALAAALWAGRPDAAHAAAPASASLGATSQRPADMLRASDDFAAAAAAACLAVFALAALRPEVRLLGVAAIATASYLLEARLRAPVLWLLAHALYVAVVIGLLSAFETMSAAPAFDGTALGVAGIAALAAVMLWLARTSSERFTYAVGVFVLVHALLATELSAVPGAPWLASVSYALVGSGLVLFGLSRQQIRIQQAGLVSLGMLVLRLFAYDLANADMGVRIVLFLACGFAFLGLSYRFRGQRPVA
ncbi:hypothetical protein BH23GEM9_BH23GEM9_31160 [soil metagenome]